MAENKSTQVDLSGKVVGEIELPSVDISKYVGKLVKVDNITEHKGNYGYYINVKTEVVDTIEKTGFDPLEIFASRILGLQQNKSGQIGWGKDTKLGIFLRKMKCKHYNDLMGKKVLLQKTEGRDGQEFLTITAP